MTLRGGWNFDQELLQWQTSISFIQPSVYIIRLVYSTVVGTDSQLTKEQQTMENKDQGLQIRKFCAK